MWTTKLDWNGSHWLVTLLRSGETVAVMTLEDFASLPVTKFLVEDHARQKPVG